MSADNGIYILQAKDGYRVVHAQAIENLWWWDDGTEDKRWKLNPKYIFDYFGNCKVLKSRQEALAEATKIYDELMKSEMPIVEYGIQSIDGWEDKEFPTRGSEE